MSSRREFITREDAAGGRVKVIAADNFLREAAVENSVVGPIMGLRAMYMYGVLLPPDAEGEHFHVGCCGFNVLGGSTGYIEPNTFVPLDRETEITPSLLDGSATVVRLTRSFGNRMLRGEKSLQSGMESGEITIRGNPADVQALHSIFDRPEELPAPHTALR